MLEIRGGLIERKKKKDSQRYLQEERTIRTNELRKRNLIDEESESLIEARQSKARKVVTIFKTPYILDHG